MEQRRFWGRWCCLAVCVWLFLVQTVYGADLEGGWRYYETEQAQASDYRLLQTANGMKLNPEPWKDIVYPAKLPLAADSRYAWLSRQLPSDLQYRNSVLFFTTTEEAVRVFLDDELIYGADDMGLYHHTYGTRWHMLQLPANYAGRQLTFQLYSDHPGRLGVLQHLSINEGIYQAQLVFRHDLLNLLALPLTVLLLSIMLFYYGFLHQQRRLYIYLSLFLAMLSVWLLASLWSCLLLWDQPTFWRYLLLACVYTMPFWGNMMVYESMDDPLRHWVLVVAGGYMLFGAEGLAGELMGYNLLDRGLQAYYIWMALGQTLVTVILLRAAWKGSRMSRGLLLPALGMPLLGVMDGLRLQEQFLGMRGHVLSMGSLLMAFFVIWLLRENAREEQRLRELAQTLEQNVAAANARAQVDVLTKCFNRAKLVEAMEMARRISQTDHAPLALLMFDIDFFKQVNDSFGHDAGDHVLIGFAQVIRQHLDARHVFIRYGGEEFLVLCQGFDGPAAQQLAEHIRRAIRATRLLEQRRVTCSIGVSVWHGEESDTPEQFLKRADMALYKAKQTGRDRVVLETELPVSAETGIFFEQED